MKQLGIGVWAYVEVTAPVGLHIEFGACEINDDGTATIFAGTSVHGQGHHTSFAMLASEVLGIPMAEIKFVNSDTGKVPRGSGTLGSRSLQTAGSAIHVASNEVMSRAKQIAANLLEASADDIVKGDGGLQVAGVPSKAVSWAELAVASKDTARLPAGLEAATLRHELDFDGQGSTFPFGAHVSVVEVDTETGGVKMLRHIAVDDCGRILNPMLVTGQQHGGIAQGAAQALFEWVQYDEAGNPKTGNLMDYAIPSAAELPFYETSNTQTDSPRNPLGAKGIGESGIGESGTIGSTPAIQNAVVDALSHSASATSICPAPPNESGPQSTTPSSNTICVSRNPLEASCVSESLWHPSIRQQVRTRFRPSNETLRIRVRPVLRLCVDQLVARRFDRDRIVAAQQVHQHVGVLFESATLILDGNTQHGRVARQSSGPETEHETAAQQLVKEQRTVRDQQRVVIRQ